MKAGMMPAKSHVPDNAPIKSKMRMASVAVPMLWAMASRMSVHVVPRPMPKAPANRAASNKAIWLEP